MIKAEIYDKNSGVVAIRETWLNNNDDIDNFLLPGFQIRGGCICVYVREGMVYRRKPELDNTLIECLWIECKLDYVSLLLGVFYNPKCNSQHFYEHFDRCIENIFTHSYDKVVIMGDFNCDL
jgi:hypothetical protein